jgi:hypothetical protein
MAYIKRLKDNELVGGTDDKDVYPVSTTQALYSQDSEGNVRMDKGDPLKPERLEDRLEDHEADALVLHSQTERLTPGIILAYSGIRAGTTFEIQDSIPATNSVTITGSAKVETYGDRPADPVPLNKMTAKNITITSSGATVDASNQHASGDYNWVGTYSVPNVVGSYSAAFNVTYNGTTKSASSAFNVNLRKFFGFAADNFADDLTNVDVTSLLANDFSNSVTCKNVAILPINDGYKYIYFAVPKAMTITEVIQLSTSYQLYIEELTSPGHYATREISGTLFDYKIYRSTVKVNSSNTVNLSIV